MLVTLMTTGQGSVRFNPNLYNDGKVRVSFLCGGISILYTDIYVPCSTFLLIEIVLLNDIDTALSHSGTRCV